MAINKKLIHFKNKLKFNEELAKGNILETSIVFILDTTEIYTHGLLYDGSTFDPSDIEASILNILEGKQDKVVSAGGTAKIDWNNDIDNVPGIRDEGPYIDFTQPLNFRDGFLFDSENEAAGGKLTLDSVGIHYEILGIGILDTPATMDIIHTGDGTKFLADDGTYKEISGGSSNANVQAVDTEDIVDDVNVEYTTKAYVDGLVGDINSVLENIING